MSTQEDILVAKIVDLALTLRECFGEVDSSTGAATLSISADGTIELTDQDNTVRADSARSAAEVLS